MELVLRTLVFVSLFTVIYGSYDFFIFSADMSLNPCMDSDYICQDEAGCFEILCHGFRDPNPCFKYTIVVPNNSTNCNDRNNLSDSRLVYGVVFGIDRNKEIMDDAVGLCAGIDHCLHSICEIYNIYPSAMWVGMRGICN